MNKLWYTNKLEYYSAIKRKIIKSRIWMNLKDIMLNKTNQSQTDATYVTCLKEQEYSDVQWVSCCQETVIGGEFNYKAKEGFFE